MDMHSRKTIEELPSKHAVPEKLRRAVLKSLKTLFTRSLEVVPEVQDSRRCER